MAHVFTAAGVHAQDPAITMGLGRFKKLIGDSTDSPVVDSVGDDTQFTGGLVVTCRF